MRKILFIFLIAFFISVCGQKGDNEVDSLMVLIKTAKNENKKYSAKAALIKRYYRLSEFEKSEMLYNKTLEKALKEKSKFGLGEVYHVKGAIFYYQSSFDSALIYFEKALAIRKEISDVDGMLKSATNIAGMYYMKQENKKAVEYYEEALKKEAELNFEEGSHVDLNNLAEIYTSLKMVDRAMSLYKKARRAYTNDLFKLMNTYQGMGYIYSQITKSDSALFYLNMAKDIAVEIGEEYSLSYILMDIGNVSRRLGKNDTAFIYLNRALKLAEKYQDKRLQLGIHGNIAAIYIEQKEPEKAMNNIGAIIQLQDELNISTNKDDMMKLFAQYYYEKNEFKNAFEYLKLFEQYKDSIYNIETTSQINEMQTKFETERKENLNQLLQSQNKVHKSTRNYLIVVLLLALLGVGGSVFAYRKIKTSKELIVYQKNLVEEKQKEILDSINYAKRIQYALLASNTLLNSNLPEHFVLFKPKDVVSGDFYWAAPTSSGFLYLTGDCTGHGVPGAFMSLLNISKLNQIVNENKIYQPDKVLNQVRKEIIQALNPKDRKEESKDGMDAVLCKLDIKTMQLEYASANNSFYIVRNGELIVCKADKMSVGKGHDDSIPFTYNKIKLQKGDTIYTYTDGFADQFGGIKGKKFMYKKLSDYLLSINHESMDLQKQKLNEQFESWKGELEQVDDVCVIGVRV